MNKVDRIEVQERLAMPLQMKEFMAATRIREWYEYYNGRVYVAFSGGKDSTVLLHLVRKYYPEVPAVFADTGLEYPEIREFVKTIDNVIWLKPAMNFKKILEKYGYPVVSKQTSRGLYQIRNTNSEYLRNLRLYGTEKGKCGVVPKKWHYLIEAPFKISDQCCEYMKKKPFKKYSKETGRQPYVGTMVGESLLRLNSYIRYGCNAFDLKSPRSVPISYFTTSDVWNYIKKYEIEYASIYDTGVERTGCVFCMYGVQHEDSENNRFHKLKKSHPRYYNYCIDKLGLGKIMDFMDVKY